MITTGVERNAPGGGIADYGFGNGETINIFQHLVVGAGKDTYRSVALSEACGNALGLLSRGGTQVVLGTELDLISSDRRALSRFDTGSTCELGMQRARSSTFGWQRPCYRT